MKHGRDWLDQLLGRTKLAEENPLKMPLVEICGDCRVLIEHHAGVIEYSQESVGVRVRYGIINVCGSGLKLCHMSADQLIISGKIQGVVLSRG